MNLVRKSILISFAERYTLMIIQLLAQMILARLLTPEEIGIFSVAAVLVGVAHILRDFGVAQYIIQEKELTIDRFRTAFGITLVFAWIIAGILAAVSTPVAYFYREPGVRQVVLVMACEFFFLPISTVVLGSLRREMDFGPIYLIHTVSTLVRALTSVSLAALGFGFMSLAWATLASIIASCLMAILYRPRNLPLSPSFKEYRRVLSFSGLATMAGVVNETGDGAPDLIVGRALSLEAVGIFSRAMGLIRLFDLQVSAAIKPVMLPHLSATHRAGKQVREPYLRVVSFITVMAWPFFTFLALMAYPTIRILYGTQWDAAVPVVRILCVYASVSALFYFSDRVFVAIGAVRKNLVLQLIMQTVTVVLIISLVPFGLTAVAAVLVLSRIVGFFMFHRFLRQLIDISIQDFVAATTKSLGVAIYTMIVPLGVLLSMKIGPEDVWAPFMVALLGASLGWIAGVLSLGHPLKEELIPLWAKLHKIFILRKV